MATIARLGWQMASAFEWVTHRGLVNIFEIPPRAVEVLLKEAVAQWQWRQVASNDKDLEILQPTPI